MRPSAFSAELHNREIPMIRIGSLEAPNIHFESVAVFGEDFVKRVVSRRQCVEDHIPAFMGCHCDFELKYE